MTAKEHATIGLPYQMKQVKLICTDIDGTLVLDDHKTIPETNLKALIRAQQEGARLALVSGRGVFSQKSFIERLQMDLHKGFIIAFTGAKIVHADSLKQVFSLPIEMADARALYSYVSKLGFDVMVYDDERGRIFATSDNEYTRFDEQVTGMPLSVIREIADDMGFVTHKCIIAGNPELMDRHLQKIKETFSPRFSITRSSAVFAEFNLAGASKGNALTTLARMLGIGAGEVLAAGNGENDASMLEAAGMSAAPADAMTEAREAAKYLCSRNNAEGALAEAVSFYMGWEYQ